MVNFITVTGLKREPDDRLIPRNIDADDSDIDPQSEDDRYSYFLLG